jgi:hypothetical protein
LGRERETEATRVHFNGLGASPDPLTGTGLDRPGPSVLDWLQLEPDSPGEPTSSGYMLANKESDMCDKCKSDKPSKTEIVEKAVALTTLLAITGFTKNVNTRIALRLVAKLMENEFLSTHSPNASGDVKAVGDKIIDSEIDFLIADSQLDSLTTESH